jgi:predicted O-methyltransferase YrrM
MAFQKLGHNTSSIDLNALMELVRRFKDPWCVEVGSWAGLSAMAMVNAGADRVYCVDHWLGNDDEISNSGFSQQEVFRAFCRNMGDELFDTVYPLVGYSRTWSEVFPHKVDLIYIDASHKYDDVWHDVAFWMRHLKTGGIMAGHDWGSFFDVEKAVRQHYPENRIKVNGTVWHIEPG